jgi:hypothetical protein
MVLGIPKVRPDLTTPAPNPVSSNYSYTGYQDPAANMGFLDRFRDLRLNQPDTLMSIAAGLMSNNLPAGIEAAGQSMARHRAYNQQNWQDQQSKNATYQWLISLGMSEQDAQAAMLNPTILSAMLRQKGYGQEKSYGTQNWAKKDGKWTPYVLDNQGNVRWLDLSGAEAVPPYDIALSKAAGTEVGKGAGDAQVALPGQKMLVEDVGRISQGLLNDPYVEQVFGTVPMTGGWIGKKDLPNISPDARRVLGKMEQLMGQSFLAARQMLKGGGQITDYEGTKADQAYSRIQSAVTYKDLKDAVDEFNYFVARGYEKLERQANLGVTQPGQTQVTPAVVPPSLHQKPANIPQATWDAMTDAEKAAF